MQKNFIHRFTLIPLLVFLLLTACGSRGNPNPVTPAGGLGMQIDSDPDDKIVRSNESSEGCAPGSWNLEGQHLKANGSLALGPIGPDPDAPELPGGVQRIDLALAQAEYTFHLRPLLGPNCTDAGPQSALITIEFAVTYAAQVDRSIDPVCVFRSRADFTQFNVHGAPNPLDAWLLDRMKSDILENLDAEVASRLNPFVFETERAADAEVRCNWAVLGS